MILAILIFATVFFAISAPQVLLGVLLICWCLMAAFAVQVAFMPDKEVSDALGEGPPQ